MGFRIFVRTSCVNVEAFYPAKGWSDEWDGLDWREDESEVFLRAMIERCIAVDPSNQVEIAELFDEISYSRHDLLGAVAFAVSGSDASIEIAGVAIANPFLDSEEYSLPDPGAFIPDLINLDFCFIKVWENTCGLSLRCEGKFDICRLTWENGRFLYNGTELESADEEGSSSYCIFYKKGLIIA